MPGCVASRIGLDVAGRRMVTKEMKGRYQRGSRRDGSAILDELCALTGWHRDHARKAVRAALSPGEPRPPRKTRAPVLKWCGFGLRLGRQPALEDRAPSRGRVPLASCFVPTMHRATPGTRTLPSFSNALTFAIAVARIRSRAGSSTC
jgi:hypothetical protein